MTTTLEIVLNGEKRSISGGTTVAELVRTLDLPGERVAVERNLEVVRRVDWDSVLLEAGDRVEVVHFVGGG
jgi:thiamine biosynthesis protein ThiS